MIANRRSPRITLALVRQNGRLAMPFTAWPTYILIPLSLILILSLFIPIQTNPRIFSPAKPIRLSGPESSASNLWFAIAPIEHGVSITTIDGQVFEFDSAKSEQERSEEFRRYLKEKVASITQAITLSNHLDVKSSLAVLSADERLTYYHLRPVIYALADAGITRYAFEGRLLKE